MISLTAIFQFLGESLGLIRQKDAQKNAEDVKAAAKAAQEASEVDRERHNVETQDTDSIRRGLS